MPAAESATSVAGMPNCWNSQDVSRAPLQPGTGLRVEHPEASAGLPAGPNNSQGSTESRRGQRSGVAVGQHALAVGRHQRPAILADPTVDAFVLFLDPAGFCFQARPYAARVRFGVGYPEHPADGPAQVDGGGPRRGDVGAGLTQRGDEVVALPRLQLRGGQHHGVGGGYADGGRAAHSHLGDGGSRSPIVGDVDRYPLVGQQSLVEQLDTASGPVDRSNFRHGASYPVCCGIRCAREFGGKGSAMVGVGRDKNNGPPTPGEPISTVLPSSFVIPLAEAPQDDATRGTPELAPDPAG